MSVRQDDAIISPLLIGSISHPLFTIFFFFPDGKSQTVTFPHHQSGYATLPGPSGVVIPGYLGCRCATEILMITWSTVHAGVLLIALAIGTTGPHNPGMAILRVYP